MLNNHKSPVGNNSRFHLLFQVTKLILITSHSNAGIEKVYSLVNKNKRQGTERNGFDIEGSLSNILVVKFHRSESKFACYNYQPDNSLLVSAIKATRLCNKAHCSKSKKPFLTSHFPFMCFLSFPRVEEHFNCQFKQYI